MNACLRPWILAALAALVLRPFDALAVQELKIGGSGRFWSETALIFSSVEDTDGSLAPIEADTTENLLTRVRELGGSAVSSVPVIGGSSEILRQLADGDRSTGWRVFTNTNGAELRVDMGAVFTLSRLLFRRGVISSDERSLRGYEIFVNDGDSLRSFIGTEPVFNLIARDPSHGEPELDVSFPPQPVRFLKLRSTGVRAFQMGDLEVFGSGVTPFAHFVSSVIELEGPANFGPVTVSARVDANASVLFSTKTGFAPDDSLYFRQTGRLSEVEEVPRGAFDRNLDPTNAGTVVENTRDWSVWSPPYTQLQGAMESPDNRQYLQFEFRLISNGLNDKAVIDSVSIAYTVPSLADSVVGEITPATAVVGETNQFTMHLRSVVGDDERRGFDTVLISTPFEVSAASVEVDGRSVESEAQWTGDQLRVAFPDDRIDRTGAEVAVQFESLVTVAGTEFGTEVADSQSDAFPQRVVAGDAAEAALSNRLIVSGTIEDRLFADISVSSTVVTPNGDGLNDDVTLKYILLKAIRPLTVTVTIYDLAGRPIRRLHDQRDSTGRYSIDWDGLDDGDRLVTPGLYVLRLVAESDGGDVTAVRTIAVAY
jgi:hypothetical protein